MAIITLCTNPLLVIPLNLVC